jgi:hypothetical protein
LLVPLFPLSARHACGARLPSIVAAMQILSMPRSIFPKGGVVGSAALSPLSRSQRGCHLVPQGHVAAQGIMGALGMGGGGGGNGGSSEAPAAAAPPPLGQGQWEGEQNQNPCASQYVNPTQQHLFHSPRPGTISCVASTVPPRLHISSHNRASSPICAACKPS